LPLLKKTAEDTQGYLKISRLNKEEGTKLEFIINMFHIDAKPFGDLARVFLDALYFWPQMNFKLIVQNDFSSDVIMDTEKVKEKLGEDLLYSSQITHFIYETIKKELRAKGIDDQFSIGLGKDNY